MRITAEWLEEQEACAEQVNLFRTTFGEAAEVTPETLARALEVGLRLAWLAEAVLTDAAWAEYEQATAPALAEYERVETRARAEYVRATYERVANAAWAEYVRATAPARAEYERVRDAARAEYERVWNNTAARLLADPAKWKPTSTERQT